jgi:hypothetical protein
MSAEKPTLRPQLDLRALPLTPEEGFVASRLDGNTDLHGLTLVTGLARDRVEAIVARLAELGAIDGIASAQPESPTESNAVEDWDDDDGAAEQPEPDSPRGRFENQLKQQGVDQRAALAVHANEPDLSALCFDPSAEVIRALLTNASFGPVHARLVAAHHTSSVGLDALCSKPNLVRDAAVRRALVKNPVLPAGVIRRLYAGRLLRDQYQLVISKDATEQCRKVAREVLRQRFATCGGEEKVDLIIKTEGRCLTFLAGVPIDGKTTALLCGRAVSSTMFVQNIARWSAAPPPLITHLLRQELVRRSPSLKAMLERHPNAVKERR